MKMWKIPKVELSYVDTDEVTEEPKLTNVVTNTVSMDNSSTVSRSELNLTATLQRVINEKTHNFYNFMPKSLNYRFDE